jgi:hypothetical protein
MAYLRQEKESFEIDYPLSSIWEAIPKTIEALQWIIEEKDDKTHNAKIKTKGAFMSYSSIIYVNAVSIDEKKTRLTVAAETPVTTITSIADFGRTKDRVEAFIAALSTQMNK